MAEGDDSPRPQEHVLAGGRVPAFPLVLLFHAEFAEAGDQHVVAGFQRLLDEFQDGFDSLARFFTAEAVGCSHRVYDIGFGEGAGLGHDLGLLSVGSFMLQVKALICQEKIPPGRVKVSFYLVGLSQSENAEKGQSNRINNAVIINFDLMPILKKIMALKFSPCTNLLFIKPVIQCWSRNSIFLSQVCFA